MINKVKCPHCKNKNEVVKRGYFTKKNNQKQQRYFCKKCNKKFVERSAFYRMRNNQEKITLCLDLFFRGISTRKVQEHLNAFYPHNSYHSTILRWVRRYSLMISNYTDNLKVNIGSEVQVDEIEYHRRKSHKSKRGIEGNWFIDSICPETKFMVASKYCKGRGKDELKNIFNMIKCKTENQVKVITTDGLMGYENAIKKVFGYNLKKNKYNVIHNRNVKIKNGSFNYPIERLHNSVRHRTKTFRGFHGSLESARAIMKGYEIYYNFITKHQTINKCPYELATDLKLKSNNKWLELINLSSK